MKRIVMAGSTVLAAFLIAVNSSCAAETGALERPTGPSVSVARIAMESPAAGVTAASATVPVALPRPGTSIILSEKVSKAIVAALKTGGSGSAVALCAVLVPADFRISAGSSWPRSPPACSRPASCGPGNVSRSA